MKLSDVDNKIKLSQFLRLNIDILDGFLKAGIEDVCQPLDLLKKRPRIKAPFSRHNVYRRVYKVNSEELFNAHKVFHSYLNSVYQPSDSVHGYVPKKNIVTNASKHLGKKYILSVDLENFFESIPKKDILRALKSLGANEEISKYLMSLLTINDTLVQGFVCSPVLSNICVHKVDEKLLKAALKYNFVYTRYADDLTISSEEKPSLEVVEKIVNECGYQLNQDKISLSRRGKKQYVTGLTIFDNERPRIPKRYKKRIRLELYYLKKFGVDSFIKNSRKYDGSSLKTVRNKVKGWIDYINAVEPDRALEYMRDFEVIEKDFQSVMPPLKTSQKKRENRV